MSNEDKAPSPADGPAKVWLDQVGRYESRFAAVQMLRSLIAVLSPLEVVQAMGKETKDSIRMALLQEEEQEIAELKENRNAWHQRAIQAEASYRQALARAEKAEEKLRRALEQVNSNAAVARAMHAAAEELRAQGAESLPSTGATVSPERPVGIPASATIWAEVVDGLGRKVGAWFEGGDVPLVEMWDPDSGHPWSWAPDCESQWMGDFDERMTPSAAAQCRQLYERGMAEQAEIKAWAENMAGFVCDESIDTGAKAAAALTRPPCIPSHIPDTDWTVIEGRAVWRAHEVLRIADSAPDCGPWRLRSNISQYADRGPEFHADVPQSLFLAARRWMGWEDDYRPSAEELAAAADARCEEAPEPLAMTMLRAELATAQHSARRWEACARDMHQALTTALIAVTEGGAP